jgi:hypothetical protein
VLRPCIQLFSVEKAQNLSVEQSALCRDMLWTGKGAVGGKEGLDERHDVLYKTLHGSLDFFPRQHAALIEPTDKMC